MSGARSDVSRPSLYTRNRSLPLRYSQRRRTLEFKVWALALYWNKPLIKTRGDGVTIARVVTRRVLKFPSGRSTQLSVIPGSKFRRAPSPIRPMYSVSVRWPP